MHHKITDLAFLEYLKSPKPVFRIFVPQTKIVNLYFVRFCFFRVLLAEQEETLEAKFLKRNPPRKSMTVCHEGQSMIESSFTSEDAAEIGADKEEEVKEEGEEKEGSKTPHACLNCNREFNLCNLISTRLSHLHS